jgi:VanZ family protein
LLLLSVAGALCVLVPLPVDPQLRWLLNAAHAPAFALWVLLLCRMLLLQGYRLNATLRWAGAAGTALAVASEMAQLAVPGRYADPVDVFINMAGVGLGLAIAGWRYQRTR